MEPGEILFGEGPIPINAGRRTAEVDVLNLSDHTIFVSSHYPFFEVNRRLVFDRAQRLGHALTSRRRPVRWRPGDAARPARSAFGGRGRPRRFQSLTEGATAASLAEGLERVQRAGYGHKARILHGR
jgi:urease beta subunit